MNINLHLRLAEKEEIPWINTCYDEAGFVHSLFDKERIVIAEVNGQRAGLGRLVNIDTENLELGGIYVFEEFRSLGIAKKIVELLLSFRRDGQIIYCIPFEHLVPFYCQYGFSPCNNLEGVPKEIKTKFLWCKKEYAIPTILLKAC